MLLAVVLSKSSCDVFNFRSVILFAYLLTVVRKFNNFEPIPKVSVKYVKRIISKCNYQRVFRFEVSQFLFK